MKVDRAFHQYSVIHVATDTLVTVSKMACVWRIKLRGGGDGPQPATGPGAAVFPTSSGHVAGCFTTYEKVTTDSCAACSGKDKSPLVSLN